MKSFYIKLFSIILIACLGILVYSNTFHCSFHFDDRSSITDNFVIRNISDLQDIWNILPRRFILYLSLALNYHYNGLDVFGYHIINLGIHLLTAILVWWLTLLTLATPSMKIASIEKKSSHKSKESTITPYADIIALLAGLLFVSHPIQTQAVTYIVQRAASMATLFYVASLCFYIKARLLSEAKARHGGAMVSLMQKIYYTCALITTVLAMFTKETAITLPLMILLYEFSFFKNSKDFKWPYTIPFLMAIFIIPLTIHTTESLQAQQMRGALADGSAGISSMHYLLTQFRVMTTYIRLIFLPLHQNLDYDYSISTSFFQWPTLVSFSFLLIIFFCAIRLFSKYRLASFSILWFFLTLLPESSFFPIRDVIFEHRLYLPMVGYSLFLASGVYYLSQKKMVNVAVITLTAIIACNSILTYQRNKIWKDEFTLWGDVIQKSPHKARAYSQLGIAYSAQGHLTEAMSNYNKAIELDPTDMQTFNDRGNIYAMQGNFTKAIADFNKAIEIHPNFASPYYDLGLIFSQQGNFTQSIADYNKAIENNPNYADAYNNRAVSYYQLKEYDKAWDDVHKAENLGYAVNPGFINALQQVSGHS